MPSGARCGGAAGALPSTARLRAPSSVGAREHKSLLKLGLDDTLCAFECTAQIAFGGSGLTLAALGLESVPAPRPLQLRVGLIPGVDGMLRRDLGQAQAWYQYGPLPAELA